MQIRKLELQPQQGQVAAACLSNLAGKVGEGGVLPPVVLENQTDGHPKPPAFSSFPRALRSFYCLLSLPTPCSPKKVREKGEPAQVKAASHHFYFKI